jgi:site-specific recombinase XerD
VLEQVSAEAEQIAPPPDPKSLLAAFIDALVMAQGKADSTALAYRRGIEDFITRMAVTDLAQVDGGLIEKYLGRLHLANLATNTRRSRLHALKSFFRWLTIRGHLHQDPTTEVVMPRQRFEELIPVLTPQEITAITTNCPRSPEPKIGRREPRRFFRRRLEKYLICEVRDRALLTLVYDCALRGGEPSLLERRDYDEAKGKLAVRNAKWQSEPILFPVRKQTALVMSLYLEALRSSRWAGHPALFPPIGVRNSNCKRPASGINLGAVANVMRKRLELAGVKSKGRRLSPHCLRYSRATHWSEGGVPIEHIQVLLRHRSIETTRRYLRLGPIGRIKTRADSPNPRLRG